MSVGRSKPFSTDLLFENPVFFLEILDDWNIHGVEINHGNILTEAGKNMRSEWSILKEPVVLK